MNTLNRSLCVLLLAVTLARFCSAGQATVGQVATEDLSGCKLPHGLQELPEDGSPKAIKLKGYIFSFARNRLAFDPLSRRDERQISFRRFIDATVADKTGDVFFKSVGDDLFLFAMSGKIQNLGAHFLYEFNGVKMSEPTTPYITEEGEKMAGVLSNVHLGECFLMRTLEKDLVLLRLVSVDADRGACTIQWVKAAPGSETFEIPKGPLVEPESSDRRRTGLAAPQLSPSDMARLDEQWKKRNELTKKVDSHLANRQSLIQYCMDIVGKAASEPNKAWLNPEVPIAVQTLGQLGATEAAPLLAKMIDARLPARAIVWELSIVELYSSAGALIAIGRPGATACLNSLVEMTAAEWERPWRARLLVLVVLRVEGEKVARFILDEKKRVLTDEQQIKNIERATALIDEVKSLASPLSDPYAIEKSN